MCHADNIFQKGILSILFTLYDVRVCVLLKKTAVIFLIFFQFLLFRN